MFPRTNNNSDKIKIQGVFGNMYGESQAAKLALKQVRTHIVCLFVFFLIQLVVAGDRARIREGFPGSCGGHECQRLHQSRHPGHF